jgi:hypothetical protein
MLVKRTVVAILFGGMLASLSALAQESPAFPNELSFERSLHAATFIPNTPNLAESTIDPAADEEREFIQRLNGVSRALSDFAAAYKGGQIDVKKVKALRKALQELEKSEWFKPQKTK